LTHTRLYDPDFPPLAFVLTLALFIVMVKPSFAETFIHSTSNNLDLRERPLKDSDTAGAGDKERYKDDVILLDSVIQ
jgi:hypothetical protein